MPLIGMYASTSRQKVKVMKDNGKTETEGPWVQVSRLANPLVNELIIDTPVKDRWNREEPEDEAQFQEFYKNPSVAQALELIFGVPVTATPRTDLMSVLLKYPGQAVSGNDCGNPCADLLRLNLKVATNTAGESKATWRASPVDPARVSQRPPSQRRRYGYRHSCGWRSQLHRRLAGDGVNFLGGAPGAGTSDGPGYGTIPGNRLDVTPNGIAKEFPYLPTPYDGRGRRHIDCVQYTGAPCVEQ